MVKLFSGQRTLLSARIVDIPLHTTPYIYIYIRARNIRSIFQFEISLPRVDAPQSRQLLFSFSFLFRRYSAWMALPLQLACVSVFIFSSSRTFIFASLRESQTF